MRLIDRPEHFFDFIAANNVRQNLMAINIEAETPSRGGMRLIDRFSTCHRERSEAECGDLRSSTPIPVRGYSK